MSLPVVPTMQKMASELVQWFEANGLNPADYRVRIEAKSIAAQRDLLKRFVEQVEPTMTPAAASHLKPKLEGIELSVEGPLPHFR
jgi:hypothetical protein